MKKIVTALLLAITLIGCSDDAKKITNNDEISPAEKVAGVKKTEPVDTKPINTLVADNQPDPTIGGKSRMEVLAECQVAIKEQLSNPRSFDTKAREIIHKKYEDGGEHLVGFKFYAKNQYNAESEHMAVCAFDGNGKRLTAEYK